MAKILSSHLDDLLKEHRKNDIKVAVDPSVEKVDRPERIYNSSVKDGFYSTGNMRINNAPSDAEKEDLTRQIVEWGKSRDIDPSFDPFDGMIDLFDPSEPPGGRPGRPDPMVEILKAEIAVSKPVAKLGMKFLSFIYTPLDRGFKFLTNALMYDPLTKSATGPVRRMAVQSAIEGEKRRLIGEAIE